MVTFVGLIPLKLDFGPIKNQYIINKSFYYIDWWKVDAWRLIHFLCKTIDKINITTVGLVTLQPSVLNKTII